MCVGLVWEVVGGFETRPYVGLVVDYGVGFDLDEDLGGYQAADLYHAGGRLYSVEELAVGGAYLFPVVDVYDVDSGPYYVGQVGA